MFSVPELSIIVPVYNSSKYLNKCLDSILSQTFKDYEVLLINDGSTDDSAKILEKYVLIDSRIKVFHKENSGAAQARNFGIEKARGKYIGFVDSDDYIEKDMYELLYNLITKYKTDISICGLTHVYDKKFINPYPFHEEKKISGLEALKIALIGDKFSVNVYNKLYNKNLFEDIKFPNIKFAEDGYVLPRILYKCKSVAFNTDSKYYWVHHLGSVTSSQFDQREWESPKVYDENLEFIRKNCPDLILEGTLRYYLAYFWILDKMSLSNPENVKKSDLKKAMKVIRKGYFKIIFNPYFNYKRKLAATILLFSWNMYKLTVKISKQKNLT